MARFHLVRVGAFSQVGRFAAVDSTRYPRDARVIVRTARGLEVGEVLAAPSGESPAEADGAIVRGMTIEDQLLEVRLRKNREAAYAACAGRLRELRLEVALVDVEHLFDGRTLVFYFLGRQPPELETVTSELAAIYDTQVQFQAFAGALTEGCGPGCGTDEASGGGCQSCATGCAVSAACGTRKQAS
ncbi:MAG TPA: PSP1 C-terminal domain-containing protein [Pirellulales bacterium]|nr:PSP1 C-terminal domain-containing protein [Pirellulales bacterium]